MFISHRWQSRIALLTALGITSTVALPMLMATQATAQSRFYIEPQLAQFTQVIIPAGTLIPVESDDAKRVIVTRNETLPITVIVARDVVSFSGTLLIPAGSEIEGEVRPVQGGSQFVAEELILRDSDQSLSLDATSEVVTKTETITKNTDPDLLKGAAIGAAAGAVLSEIFGKLEFWEVLAGAGLGLVTELLLAGGQEDVEVVVIDPDTDLDITLKSDLVLNLDNR
ncbi:MULTISPECIES: hypothetical protein [Moorena]|uniref:hypothetical protein n=1 Tax=Moorena TaxID=1155738 RepID=UPI00142CD297|nr:hypothetical protein [Moorena sp. SIO4G3]NEO78877.1 hypothetical protein [Moorena sp. SIO4G3]